MTEDRPGAPTRPTLAVTGSTGVVGGHVARLLADQGIPQRLLARTPSAAPVLPGATAEAFGYRDDELTAEALDGVRVLFMVSAAESADRLEQHRAFIDAAARAGVEHVVYTSFIGAAPDAVFTLARDHFATEQHLRASGMAWTFLRDNFYADFMPMLVGEDGVIRGPAGDGRAAIVARIDVARGAAAVLQAPAAHAGRSYDITGPEALDFSEVAAIVGAHEGRPVSFHDETVEEAYESRRVWEAPDWQVDAWVSTYTSIGSGAMSEVSPDVEAITGTRPLTLEELLRQG